MSSSVQVNIISYSYIKQIFDSVNFKMDISQFHGYLSGYNCSDQQQQLAMYITKLKHYTGASELIDKITDDIANVYQQNIKIVQDENLGAQLALPDLEDPLTKRIQALGLWCQGFTDGFYDAIDNNTQDITLSDDANEILSNLATISNVDHLQYEDNYNQDDTLKIAETDLFNISEFVKLSWINLYLEYQSEDNQKQKED